jgi:transcriptional regulator with XRE-family HTH domain
VIELSENRCDALTVRFGMQIKIARIILGWDQKRLADEAHIGVATVQRAERADQPPITAGNLFAIQRALEGAGITFIDDERQPGVRWQR